ncbi:MAG: replication initiation protein [Clostridia bacterium]|nr:replication initiation protein [Clostridia bacterium]
MANKKLKNEELTGNLDPKHWVQKSDPLVMMRSVPFSLGELKILDTYISRINAADDTRRTVIFTKEEYEELMGISCVDYRTLRKHTKGMLGKVVELQMPNKDYLQFVLFEQARYHKDEYGKPIIELTCTTLAQDLFFCINKYHYFKYALENVIHLTHKSSYLLYVYIRTNRYRGEWDIDLNELRDTVLDCKGQESYQEYKVFKRDVLNPAVKEVNAKTDCHFEYESIKRGRRVVKIKFIYLAEKHIDDQLSLDRLPNVPQPPDQSEDRVNQSSIDETDIISQLHKVCDYEFTRENINSAYKFAKTFIHDKTMKVYFEQTYLKLLEIEKKRKIRDRFSYFYQIICSDADRQRKEQQDKDRNIGYQPTYNIAEYESTSIIDEFDDEEE